MTIKPPAWDRRISPHHPSASQRICSASQRLKQVASNAKCRAGAAAIELALLLPCLIPLGLAVIDCTRILHVALSVSVALQTGADAVATKGYAQDQVVRAQDEIEFLLEESLRAILPSTVSDLQAKVSIAKSPKETQISQLNISCRVPLIFTWGGLAKDPLINNSLTVRRHR